MQKSNLLSSFSARLNRRKLITRAVPTSVVGTLLGTLSVPAHAQGYAQISTLPRGNMQEIKSPGRQSLVTDTRFFTAWAISGGNSTQTWNIDNLNGNNIFVTTSVSSYNGFGSQPSGSIFISQYSDAGGIHTIDGTLGNALTISGATSITLAIGVQASYLAGFLEILFIG